MEGLFLSLLVFLYHPRTAVHTGLGNGITASKVHCQKSQTTLVCKHQNGLRFPLFNCLHGQDFLRAM